jgi:hypothetical protein
LWDITAVYATGVGDGECYVVEGFVEPEGGASSGCYGGGVGAGDREDFALCPGLFVCGIVRGDISGRRDSGYAEIGVVECCVGEPKAEFEAGCDIVLFRTFA